MFAILHTYMFLVWFQLPGLLTSLSRPGAIFRRPIIDDVTVIFANIYLARWHYNARRGRSKTAPITMLTVHVERSARIATGKVQGHTS